MKSAIRRIFTVVCIVLGTLAIYNVMSDNDDVLRMAEKVACGDSGAACRPQMTRMERSPFSQSFEIVTTKRTYEVRCTRAFVFAGAYSCVLH
jgi:hypothetical protein